jgi:hypothetical protein
MVAPFRGAYLDDILFAAPATQAAAFFSGLVDSLASIGLEVNLTKSFCPGSCFRRHTSWELLGAPGVGG